MTNDLKEWVREVLRTDYEGVAGRLADAIDMSESAFSRGLAKGTLSVDSLLRLAEVAGEPASKVLIRAGKPDIAALIERLYGPEHAILPAPVQDVVDFLMDESPRAATAVQQQMIATARWWKGIAHRPPPIVEPTFSSRPGVKSKRATRGTRKR